MAELLLKLRDSKDVRVVVGVVDPLLLLLHVAVQLLVRRGELEIAGDKVLHVGPGISSRLQHNGRNK